MTNSTVLTTSFDDMQLQLYIDKIVSKMNFSFMLIGIISNLLCISVFANKQQLKRKFHYYLLALSIADLLYCIIIFFNYLTYVLDPPNVLYDLSRLTCYFTDYIVGSIDAFCYLQLLTLSVDRIYAITRPLKLRNFLTYRSPRILILGTMVLVLVFKSPEIFLSQRNYELETYGVENISNNSHSRLSSFFCWYLIEIEIHFYFFLETSVVNYESYWICTCKSNEIKSYLDRAQNMSLYIYIFVCNIVLPFVLHLIPSVAILVLNLVLWFYIQNYNKDQSTISKYNYILDLCLDPIGSEKMVLLVL